jgi:hypothetical protein
MDKFEAVLEEMRFLHDSKSQGYGRKGDPFYNIREGGRLVGIPAWAAAVSRAGDKITRISAHLNGAQITDEKLRDNILDAAIYFAIALALYDEHPHHPTVDTSHFQDRINRLLDEFRDLDV